MNDCAKYLDHENLSIRVDPDDTSTENAHLGFEVSTPDNGAVAGPHTVPVLVNRKEHEADALLQEVGGENGHRLLTKVRLVDVVEPGDWMEARPQLGYFALRAHLDFVMVDTETSVPVFAVEIDGTKHSQNQAQRNHDVMKNELCRAAGLPLLRVNSDFGLREGKYVLLKYICDAFYKSIAFEEAQTNGAIPWDEPFDHASFIHREEATGDVLFGSIDARARLDLLNLWKAGRVPNFVPDSWVGETDKWGNILAESYLAVGEGKTLVGSSRVRHFGFFGMPASELADELAMLDLQRNVLAWLDGEPVALARETFQTRFRAFVATHNPLNHISSGGGNPERRIPYPDFHSGADDKLHFD